MPFCRQNANVALEKIDAILGKEQTTRRILDFGAGFGFFLSVAKERGWDAYGLEPLPATAVYARAKFGLNIMTDTVHENSFPEQYFDVVTSFQVFEHLPDPLHNLKCLWMALKKGGIILIEVPRFDTWSMKLLRSKHRHFVQDHLNFFSIETLGLFLRKNGFEVIESFQPKRIMSAQHLFDRWLAEKFPIGLRRIGNQILRMGDLGNKSVDINVGDMLTVIGRKNGEAR